MLDEIGCDQCSIVNVKFDPQPGKCGPDRVATTAVRYGAGRIGAELDKLKSNLWETVSPPDCVPDMLFAERFRVLGDPRTVGVLSKCR
jgi:hypothetical protein